MSLKSVAAVQLLLASAAVFMQLVGLHIIVWEVAAIAYHSCVKCIFYVPFLFSKNTFSQILQKFFLKGLFFMYIIVLYFMIFIKCRCFSYFFHV